MIKKILFSFLSRLSAAGISFVLLLVTARFMGPEVRGQISFFVLALALIQVINEIACGPASVYVIPRSYLPQLSRLVYSWILICTLLCGGVLFLFRLIPPDQFIHLLLLSLIICTTSFHQQVLLAAEKITHYNILLLIPPVLLFFSLLVEIFYFQQKDFHTYIFCVYLSQLPAFVCGLLFLIPQYRTAKGKYEPAHARLLIKNGLFNQLANIAHLLSNRVSFYLIGLTALVGIYSTGVSVIESVWMISSSISTVLIGRVANEEDQGQSRDIILRAARLSTLLSLCGILLLYALPVSLYTKILGASYVQIKELIYLLGPGVLCISFSSILGPYFTGTGRNFTITLANFTGLIVIFIGAVLLIPDYGLKGAAVATSISYFCSSVFLLLAFRHGTSLHLKDFFPGKAEIIFIWKQLKHYRFN